MNLIFISCMAGLLLWTGSAVACVDDSKTCEEFYIIVRQQQIHFDQDSCLRAIESEYPDARNRKVLLYLALKFPPDKPGHVFLARLNPYLESFGYAFLFRGSRRK